MPDVQALIGLCCLGGQREPAEPAADGREGPARAHGAPEGATEGPQQSARPREDAASECCPPAPAIGELPGTPLSSSHNRRCIRSACRSTGHPSLMLKMTLRTSAAHLCQQLKGLPGAEYFLRLHSPLLHTHASSNHCCLNPKHCMHYPRCHFDQISASHRPLMLIKGLHAFAARQRLQLGEYQDSCS